jgi:uncharacterized damage-inducible protein DinB
VSESIARFYGDWRLYNDLIVEALRGMSAEELALRSGAADPGSASHWPIWAIAAHTVGARVHWLCKVIGVPGIETTPFAEMGDDGWEDDLDHPRSSEELVEAWTSTWGIVERALRTWSAEDLELTVARQGADGRPLHLTRRSLLTRLIVHEGYHAGEIALIQGIHGRTELDLWPPGDHTVEAELERRQG